MSKNVDDEFYQGYLDGYDLQCPEPNGNRHPAYVHSFEIARRERMGLHPFHNSGFYRQRAMLIKKQDAINEPL